MEAWIKKTLPPIPSLRKCFNPLSNQANLDLRHEWDLRGTKTHKDTQKEQVFCKFFYCFVLQIFLLHHFDPYAFMSPANLIHQFTGDSSIYTHSNDTWLACCQSISVASWNSCCSSLFHVKLVHTKLQFIGENLHPRNPPRNFDT